MYCPYCGKELLHKEGTFCAHCGKSLEGTEPLIEKEDLVVDSPSVEEENTSPKEKLSVSKETEFSDAVLIILALATLLSPIIGIGSGIYSLICHKDKTKGYILLGEALGLILLRSAFILPFFLHSFRMIGF